MVRRDIQLLRGLAVLMVVLYHAGFGFLNAGYLGVDVFFVVSGFLITSHILKQLNGGAFSFTAFYLRRAQRLLPALYCTLIVATILAYGFLTRQQWQGYMAQLVGAVTFSANFVLPTQVGYFDGKAQAQLLLHIWSLSLEEQYYFFLPLVLFFVSQKYRGALLLILALLSFYWCISWAVSVETQTPVLWRLGGSPADWAFYFFPARAWELLAGSLGAWVVSQRWPIVVPAVLKWISLVTIVAVSAVGVDTVHPRGNALIVVIATLLIVLGNDQWLPRWRSVLALERLGDWSYSVYLVHWPLFVFAYLGFTSAVPVEVRLALVLVSIVLGYAQYRWVETPFRYGWNLKSRSALGWFVAMTVAVLLLPAPAYFDRSQSVDFGVVQRSNMGLSRSCDDWESYSRPECRTTDTPQVVVWGDSYAMHLVPGLVMANASLMQVTKAVCGPFLGLAPVEGSYSSRWAESCIGFNDSALKTITQSDAVSHVVLASSFSQYFNLGGDFLMEGGLVERRTDLALEALVRTVEAVQAAGKIPVIISPPPRVGFDVGECLERESEKVILLRDGCEVLYADYLDYDHQVIAALTEVEARTGVKVIWLSELMCDSTVCNTVKNDTYLYRDGGHLTISGSKELLGQLKIL